jgi:hypothetical protein
MTLVAKCFAFLLMIAFFCAVGWYFYLLNRLWNTSQYGGKIYNSTFLKACASMLLLWLAFSIADAADIPKETKTVGIYFAMPFFLVGWFLRKKKESRRNDKEQLLTSK